MVRQLTIADRLCGELIGPGAVLRPWDDFGDAAPLPFELRWRVLSGMRIALLDRRFELVMARHRPLLEAFLQRTMERVHTLAFTVAIHCMRLVSMRLLMLFWQLADRFGKVTPGGVHIRVVLSHRDLAELVGAARPSVTVGLSQLAEKRQLWRMPDGTWMLSHEPPEELRELRSVPRAASAPSARTA